MMVTDFPEQDKVLYCFRFIPDESDNIAKLARYSIPHYEQTRRSPYKTVYKFFASSIDISGKYYSINVNDLDHVSHNKVFTFDSSLEHAEALFESYFTEKISNMKDRLSRLEADYSQWRSRDAQREKTTD